jgi:hypothetical protein
MIEFKVAERGQLHSAILNAPIEYCEDGYMVTITPMNTRKKAKTDAQRNAFHLWLRLLAEELNAAGLDQRVVLAAMKEGVERPWTLETAKENLWRPLQQVVVKKALTENLAIDEHNDIYNILHRWLSERGWPCPAWPDRWNANPKKIK